MDFYIYTMLNCSEPLTGLLAETVRSLVQQFDEQPDYCEGQGEPFAK